MTAFSSIRLIRIIASVQANSSGVLKKIFAWYSASPMLPSGRPITSAATPAFQHMPSDSSHALSSAGYAAGR